MPFSLSSADVDAKIIDPLGLLAYACGNHCPSTMLAEDIIIAWLISLPGNSAVALAARQAVLALRKFERAIPDNTCTAMRDRLIELLTTISQTSITTAQRRRHAH